MVLKKTVRFVEKENLKKTTLRKDSKLFKCKRINGNLFILFTTNIYKRSSICHNRLSVGYRQKIKVFQCYVYIWNTDNLKCAKMFTVT